MSYSHEIKPIRNAGCLIIGDEILNGKILDTNSYNFAKFCFNKLSIPLKKTIVCGDDEQDIRQSLNILTKENNLDLVVTSGGLGSTHDDITYKVLSDYFNVDYKLDQEVVERMRKLRGPYLDKMNSEQLAAYYRMATIPSQTESSVKVNKYFSNDNLWFPIVELNQQVYILPGVPQLFTSLLESMESLLLPRIQSQKLTRRYVLTETSESKLAPFVAGLQISCDEKYGTGTIKLGSYPHMKDNKVTICIIGKDLKSQDLDWIVSDLIENLQGNAREISQEEEDKCS